MGEQSGSTEQAGAVIENSDAAESLVGSRQCSGKRDDDDVTLAVGVASDFPHDGGQVFLRVTKQPNWGIIIGFECALGVGKARYRRSGSRRCPHPGHHEIIKTTADRHLRTLVTEYREAD